ncbi:DUF927 domain-containing protein [Acinetobacter boissieri]|uniref:Uncharcterized protein, DUF927 family n=1 Tax=Acinetobacter boissieri TaxID=1219383 RepID=A0A1G6K453_9GAMM|nr:DUF927 domain-containing protein [Acinetobacter boissieri]SDC25737.1 Uncharcterized protein, DUF927 family [Acinetobacter boissieri]
MNSKPQLGNTQTKESPLKKVSNQKPVPTSHSDIIAQSEVLKPHDNAYLEHDLVVRFGSPKQPIYVMDDISISKEGDDPSKDKKYTTPLLLPIVDGSLQQIQTSILSFNQTVCIYPDNGIAKGFAYFGEMVKDQPVIITHHLEPFFKVASTGYAVVLVLLPNVSKPFTYDALSGYDLKQVEFVVNQLSKAGYTALYMPTRPEHIKADGYVQLEQNTAVRLLNQYTQVGNMPDLACTDDTGEAKAFLDEAIHLLKPIDVLPKGHLAKPFKMDNNACVHILDSGLYLIKETTDADGETKQTKTFISSPVTILGEARNKCNDHWKRVVQFRDKDNYMHTLLIPYEHIMGEAQDALRIIANHGLMPPRQVSKKNVFMNYIQDYPIEKRFRCVVKTGWYDDAYVTAHKTYGNTEGEDLLFSNDRNDPYSTQGTFAGWQQLSQLIEPHALAVLSFSCAFAGQLVAPLHIESGGFHIYGSSTDGKSTITKASCSIWGSPKTVSKSWRTTDNALEAEAEIRNDNFLNLDELRQAVPKAVSDIIYMLSGGDGKARANRSGKNKEVKTFNLTYCSTGEVMLEEHLRRGGLELDAGLLIRFAQLPSDAGHDYGVFETINYGTRPQDVANRINELASRHYGHAGVKWLTYLTQDKDSIMERAKGLLEGFIKQYSPKTTNGQTSRVLRRFALVAVAGELATQADITGWQRGRAFDAVGQCFNTWLNSFGDGSNLEETKILEHFKAFIESHGSSRFESLIVIRHADGEVVRPRIHNQVGYYDPDEKTYLVSSTLFKKEMCLGINEANAKKVLKKNGWIDCDNGRYDKRVGRSKLPSGERPAMLHFNERVIQNSEI